ncbi:MAG: glycosyltransferase family 1 protein [Faecousia sp.]
MMRVLQVVTHMNRGGLETMLMNYYRCIDRQAIQFDFLTHRPYEGNYAEEIHQLGGLVYHLPVLNPFSLHYRKLLGQFFDEHPEYQIIHVHQDCLSSVILSVAMQHGVKVRIAHSHSASQDKDIKYPIKLLYRRFIPKYATDLMACGRDAGEWMFRGAEFRILNNAIDTGVYTVDYEKRSSLRKQLGIEADEFVVGHVGRFSPPKNHWFLIDIYYQIKQIAPKARLLLVGKDIGENADRIKEKVKTLQLQDSVTFAGLRPDVADLMQAMDVFVFPSVYEGLPVTMVEAQAAGLPCLISDKVPIECKVTDLVQQIPLADGAEVWAKKAIAAAKETVREDTSVQIKAAGFDIAENAKWLQNYYLSALEKV